MNTDNIEIRWLNATLRNPIGDTVRLCVPLEILENGTRWRCQPVCIELPPAAVQHIKELLIQELQAGLPEEPF